MKNLNSYSQFFLNENESHSQKDLEAKIKEAIADIYFNYGRNNCLDEGFAKFAEQTQALRKVGGMNYHAHGMGKSGVARAFVDLFDLFNNGIDPKRGGGRLYTAPLGATGMETGGATASGVYADGPFILVSKNPEVRNISQIVAILVNDGMVDIRPDLLSLLARRFPKLLIGRFSKASEVVKRLNQENI